MPLTLLTYAALAGVAFALIGFMYRRSAQYGCRFTEFAIAFTAVAAAVTGTRAIFWEATPWADGRLWGLGAAMCAPLYVTLALMVTLSRRGPASVIWTVLNLSLVVPLALSVLCLGEPWGLGDFAILAVFALMLGAFRRGMAPDPGTAADILSAQTPAARNFWFVLGLMFLTNGLWGFGPK